MKNFFNSYIPYVIGFFLLFVTFESVKLYFDEHKTTERLTENLAALQKEAVYFKARNGDQAVKLTSQELTIKELKATIPDAIQAIKNLYIPPRLVQGFIRASSQTVKPIVAVLRDSITPDNIRLRVMAYDDKWFQVKQIIRGDTSKLNILTCDSLTVVPVRARRNHPWLWILSKRGLPELVISNKNPFNRITIEKSVVIKK